MQNKNKIQLKCVTCDKEFFVYPSGIKNDNLMNCSRSCQTIWQKFHNRKTSPLIKCKNCGRYDFRRRIKSKFCSYKCSSTGKFNSMFKRKPWNKGKKFLAGQMNPNWRGGHRDWRGTGWKKIRKSILIRDRYKCQICGGTRGKGKLVLVVDHKIPWRISQDNSPNNLQTAHSSCNIKKDWKYFKDQGVYFK